MWSKHREWAPISSMRTKRALVGREGREDSQRRTRQVTRKKVLPATTSRLSSSPDVPLPRASSLGAARRVPAVSSAPMDNSAHFAELLM